MSEQRPPLAWSETEKEVREALTPVWDIIFHMGEDVPLGLPGWRSRATLSGPPGGEK